MLPINVQHLAEANTILRCVVGSTLHGLAVTDGLEDRDEMGVCIEPPDCVIGLQRFEQWVHRTKSDGVRSEAGDLDLVIFSLRKWMRLALRGNPTVLLLMFAPEPMTLVQTGLGARLQSFSPALACRKHGEAFVGYLQSQRSKLESKSGLPTRPELIERYGFDTKYAMHMLRLGHQGIEYLTTGVLTLPIAEPTRTYLWSVRMGEVPLADVMQEARELEMKIQRLADGGSPLPAEPDFAAANMFLQEAYRSHWHETRAFEVHAHPRT